MGALTGFLQTKFKEYLPPPWQVYPERHLLPVELEVLFGYAPRADLVLENSTTGQRLWLEFEISRADPVANHAKFATAHFFRPLSSSESFVSMVSPHIARGRRNLAANTILVMQSLGIQAFQTVLFPHTAPEEVKRLNHLDLSTLSLHAPAVKPEVERVLAFAQALDTVGSHKIFFTGDILEVIRNLRHWSEEVKKPEGARLWGRRTVTYFVYDPYSKAFAPAKFCAFNPIPAQNALKNTSGASGMTLEIYASLGEQESRFDGHIARNHLVRNLAMQATPAAQAPGIATEFSGWHSRYLEYLRLHPNGPVFLLPPGWF